MCSARCASVADQQIEDKRTAESAIAVEKATQWDSCDNGERWNMSAGLMTFDLFAFNSLYRYVLLYFWPTDVYVVAEMDFRKPQSCPFPKWKFKDATYNLKEIKTYLKVEWNTALQKCNCRHYIQVQRVAFMDYDSDRIFCAKRIFYRTQWTAEVLEGSVFGVVSMCFFCYGRPV